MKPVLKCGIIPAMREFLGRFQRNKKVTSLPPVPSEEPPATASEGVYSAFLAELQSPIVEDRIYIRAGFGMGPMPIEDDIDPQHALRNEGYTQYTRAQVTYLDNELSTMGVTEFYLKPDAEGAFEGQTLVHQGICRSNGFGPYRPGVVRSNERYFQARYTINPKDRMYIRISPENTHK